jgi:DNA-binding response OmpR family regulator
LALVLGRALDAEGFDVQATAIGHEAAKRFSQDPPHVLVLDSAELQGERERRDSNPRPPA